jgi:prevent-host-death family protein
MAEIGVRELKAGLSDCVRRARLGEVITITDRGHPVAILAPLPGRAHLDQGIEEGWVTPPTRAGLTPVRRGRAHRPVAEVLDEDREG